MIILLNFNISAKGYVTVSLIKIQLLMILKKGLLTELEENKKNLRKAITFFGVGPVLGW